MTELNNKTNTLTAKRERNYGIDILRIISMFMVTLLHFCGFSGLSGTPDAGAAFYINSAFYVLCYAAVDIFALISGYVMYEAKVKYSRIVGLWFQVTFYSVVLSLIEKLTFGVPMDITHALLPLTYSNVWYFQAYFLMFFFIPLYNEIVEKVSKKLLLSSIVIGVIVFCLFYNWSGISGKDVLLLKNGYSFLWISFCFVIGAYIKKYKEDISHISNRACWIAILVSEAVSYLVYVLLFNRIASVPIYSVIAKFFLDYTSVTTLIPAICILIIFSRVQVKRGKGVIRFFSSTAFSVYVIQVHALVWEHFIKQYYTFFKGTSFIMGSALILAGAVALYLAASCVDYLRILLFRLLHIDDLSKLICKLAEKIINVLKRPIEKYIGE